jgi:hypothetical protein
MFSIDLTGCNLMSHVAKYAPNSAHKTDAVQE